LDDIRAGRVQSSHPSLLGAILAWELAQPLGIPAFFVDPVSVDEFWEPSRFSGLPELPRKALSHALNVKMVAKETARRLKKPYNRCNFLIAHLGTGITIAAHLKGRQVDASNANEDGPFSPQRTGSLPLPGLLELSYSGRYSKAELIQLIQRQGGLLAYLKTDDIPEIEARIDKGDEYARQVYDAMIYQIAKELGAYAVVLKGRLDALIITGGMANSPRLVKRLKSWIRFLAPRIFVYPGEHELKALALGALRVLKGEEDAKEYE
jgi:butyrate kinase